MPSKNDLSALKGEEKKILPEPVKTQELKPKAEPRRGGRPKKKRAEKRDYKIVISLTQAEGQLIRESAGLTRDATYLYDILKRSGVFKQT